MTITLHGVGVSRGIAIGRVHILERDQLEISEYPIDEDKIEDEIARLDNALTIARQQLRAVREHIPARTAVDIAEFIDTHLLMLDDFTLTQEPAHLIRERTCNAEWALKLQHDALVSVFDEMDDPYLRTRKNDVDHVVHRIQRILLNHSPLRHEVPDSRLKNYIILADDLTPADAVLMQHHGIAAFATEYGGPTSHTAILARSLEIPSIVGLYHASRYVQEDDLLIIDGGQGVLLVDPDPLILDQYHQVREKAKQYYAELIKLKGAPAITEDGTTIELHANIELPSDFKAVEKIGATGVGLYRTEFLFMNRMELPTEDDHFNTYRDLLTAIGGIPVTIRTLDLGADKQVDGGRQEGQGPLAANPALGLRAIRLCLKQPALFIPQLRAIIRVSAFGPVRLMIPMLSHLEEMYQVFAIIEEIRGDLRAKNIAFDPDMPIGGMIEVPAAALCADTFAEHLDFMSIGTNDLIQYTMAIDRVNDEVNYLYDPLNLGVLRLIKMTIEAGEKHSIPVAMCGEMAGDTRFVRLLLGLGLREFSVHVSSLLEVKRIVNLSRLEQLTPVAHDIMTGSKRSKLDELLEDINRLM